MNDEEKSDVDKLVQKHADQLSEHFDSVRIFVTVHKGGEDTSYGQTCGKGNFFAQKGQVSEWLAMQEQYERNQADRNEQNE